MSQTVIPMAVLTVCIAGVSLGKWVTTSLFLGRPAETLPNILYSAAGLYMSYKDFNTIQGNYMYQRDLAISDAIHEGKDKYLGPELERELDNVYMEYFLSKAKKQE